MANLFGWNVDLIPGVNVGNAVRQVTTGEDYDVFDGITNSNRPGQLQINGNYDVSAPGNAGYIPRSGGGASGGGASGGGSNALRSLAAFIGGGGGGGGSNALGSSAAFIGGGGGGGAAALPALNRAAINNTQIALDQLPALLDAALRAEATRRDNTLRGFNDQETGQRKQYDESTTTNQQNYDSNYMAAIRSGIQGLSGLFNLLRGSGAAGGTAQDVARDTVGGVTANDIRMGADTQQGNQRALDTSLSTFLTDLKGKRQAAEDTFRNNESAYRRDNLSQQQDLMSKMASYYSDGGRAAEATNWMNRAGSLTPAIAQNSMAKQSAYDTTPVAVKAPELSAFSAPSQPDVAVATPDQVGTGIFTMNKKKEQQDLVPVGV